MRTLIREIYYFLIGVIKKLKYKTLIIGNRAKIAPNAVFEGYNKIEHHSYFSGEMGTGSYIGEYSSFSGKVGRYCSIGGHVNVLSLTHPVRGFVSSSPCFYSVRQQVGFSYVSAQKFNEQKVVSDTSFPIIVENDVYIGFGATIIAPVVIANGAVIAAGSVVTKDVAPYTIVAGNPAKEIGKRFSDEDIDSLLKIEWWNKEKQWIQENADKFENIQDFLSYVESEDS